MRETIGISQLASLYPPSTPPPPPPSPPHTHTQLSLSPLSTLSDGQQITRAIHLYTFHYQHCSIFYNILVGFGDAARTRIFKSINTLTGALRASPPHPSFDAPLFIPCNSLTFFSCLPARLIMYRENLRKIPV